MVTTLLDVRDDFAFPFHGQKRRAKSKRKETAFQSCSVQLDSIASDNLAYQLQQETTNMSVSDNDQTVDVTQDDSTISHLFSEMKKIQLVEKGKVYPLSVTEEKKEHELEIGPEVYDYTDVDLDIDFPSVNKQQSNDGFVPESNRGASIMSGEPSID